MAPSIAPSVGVRAAHAGAVTHERRVGAAWHRSRVVDELEMARAKRWWQAGRPVGRIDRAGRFIDDVGFAMLFPKAGVELPTLWQATTDRTPWEGEGDWGPDMDRVWRWKDELPRRGLAWYGAFVRGRKSFLSPSLLADLYPRTGRPDDFEEGDVLTRRAPDRADPVA